MGERGEGGGGREREEEKKKILCFPSHLHTPGKACKQAIKFHH